MGVFLLLNPEEIGKPNQYYAFTLNSEMWWSNQGVKKYSINPEQATIPKELVLLGFV